MINSTNNKTALVLLMATAMLFATPPGGVGMQTDTPASPQDFDIEAASRFARLALDCVHQEYPNKIAHVLQSDADVKPPRELTPAFYGCYDWHSAVHGHWMLARLARVYPQAEFTASARAALAESLTEANIRGEVEYIEGKGRVSFERPYGLAWLLQLAAELRQWEDAEARGWVVALEPLERLAVARLADWLPKLTHPIRIGEHAQTAFAFGLILDWARIARDGAMETLMIDRGAGFPFAVPGRGRSRAPSSPGRGVRLLACGVPTGNPGRRLTRVDASCCRNRSHRSEAGPS